MRGKAGTAAPSPLLQCAYCHQDFRPKHYRPCMAHRYRYCSVLCSVKARAEDPAVQKQIIEAAKVRGANPAYRAIISAISRRTWTGRKHSENTIALIKHKAQRRFQDPVVCQKQAENGRATRFKPGHIPSTKLPPDERLIRDRISNFVHKLIARCLLEKRERTCSRLGYSTSQLRKHIESLLSPGMSWDNYGRRGWHIDHIRPICTFQKGTPAATINALSNLRPLWWLDNMSRPRKYEA